MPSRPATCLLDEALEAWADARGGVIAELENIPSKSMAFRPSPDARSVAELIQHIIESALMWSGELTDPNGDFTRREFAAFIKEHAGQVRRRRTKPSLLRLFKDSHAKGRRQIRGAGEPAMLRKIRRFDGERWTRLTWMHHGVAHEEYHRAQVALYARLMGRTPALTKLIRGE